VRGSHMGGILGSAPKIDLATHPICPWFDSCFLFTRAYLRTFPCVREYKYG